jgi:hypothetical protein
MGPSRGSTPRQTDWQTVSRNMTWTWITEDRSEEFDPCGGGVEYLHRDPASRRRRRKGKSQIWDSKIWSRVPRDSDPRMTPLARPSSNCKRQTRTVIREGAPHQQTRSCLTVSSRWVLYSKTDWKTDRRSWHKTRLDWTENSSRRRRSRQFWSWSD